MIKLKGKKQSIIMDPSGLDHATLYEQSTVLPTHYTYQSCSAMERMPWSSWCIVFGASVNFQEIWNLAKQSFGNLYANGCNFIWVATKLLFLLILRVVDCGICWREETSQARLLQNWHKCLATCLIYTSVALRLKMSEFYDEEMDATRSDVKF